ncbi:hypothetical protein [Bacteroides nordii]|uniref:hypothetical protein n=1 Tax=Bacteroides nordii TaxID=291645 RepID=UPI00399A0040
MMKKVTYLLLGIALLSMVSCKEDTDLSPQLTGFWKQSQIFIDDESFDLTDGELNTSLYMEANGVYRLFDGTTQKEHPGTWLFSDGNWLNLTMDKIQSKNTDNSYRFGQVLVRFTILNVNDNEMELRIKTYLYERKLTVMFNLMAQDDTTGMTGEELLELDTQNKKIHTYRYVFKKVNL